MAKKSAYNYTIVMEYKQKLVIPYTGLEFEGWPMIIAFGLSVITGTASIGMVLSTFMGSNGYFLSFLPSFFIPYTVVKFSEFKDDETGRTKFEKFYYKHIKKYKFIYDVNGIEYVMKKRVEGVMFNVCAKNVCK